ncbi:hypothetical protein KKG20_03715 [bacterium]|nr:hypothetical protein [bacterium]
MKKFILLILIIIISLIGGWEKKLGISDETDLGDWKKRVEEKIEELKVKYDFSHWPAKEGQFRLGFPLSPDLFPNLSGAKEVSKSTFLRENDGIPISEIEPAVGRIYCWEVPSKGSLEIETFMTSIGRDAQEYLIEKYAERETRMTSMAMPMPREIIRLKGFTVGLSLGDICFVEPGPKEGIYNEIDFIKDNIVVRVQGRGEIRKEIKDIAIKINSLIPSRIPVPSIDRYRARVKELFPVKDMVLKLSEEWEDVPIIIEVEDPAGGELVYKWESLGRIEIEKDEFGRYIASIGPQDQGIYDIDVFIINDYLLANCDSLRITVVEFTKEEIKERIEKSKKNLTNPRK